MQFLTIHFVLLHFYVPILKVAPYVKTYKAQSQKVPFPVSCAWQATREEDLADKTAYK
jgi:hypothetical protein